MLNDKKILTANQNAPDMKVFEHLKWKIKKRLFFCKKQGSGNKQIYRPMFFGLNF